MQSIDLKKLHNACMLFERNRIFIFRVLYINHYLKYNTYIENINLFLKLHIVVVLRFYITS